MAHKKRSKKRKAAKNPTKAKRRVKRRRASNPSHHAPKRRVTHRRRARRANPAPKKHHRAKRRSRRNPGVPIWAMAGISAVVSLAAFAALWGGSVAVTSALDPTGETVVRNRRIAGVLVAVGGVALAAFASPIIGAGVAAAGLVAAAGFESALAVVGLLPKPERTAAALPAPSTQGVAGVLRGGQQHVGAVMRGGQQTMVGDSYAAGQGVSIYG